MNVKYWENYLNWIELQLIWQVYKIWKKVFDSILLIYTIIKNKLLVKQI